MSRDLHLLHARPEPTDQPASQHLDAPEQGRVALQSTPEIHGLDEVDQFALGAGVARAILSGRFRTRR